MNDHLEAIEAIKKKLIGKTLNYQEIYSIMDELAKDRLGPVLTTYFAAAGFREGFTDEELFYLTKAMVETGPQLHFDGIVADKHSTGGVAGTRVSMILVPIIAAAGFNIPKTSSRAITSPAGTADTMEIFAPVVFNADEMKSIVEEVGGCIIWGGPLGLAPADDVIIQVEEKIAFESYDKLLVAIMAKKVASGATHVVFDIPVGKTLKVKNKKDAEIIERKLKYLASRFSLEIVVDINEMIEPASNGIGPLLEARDVLLVLEQHSSRPMHLENKALHLSSKLLQLCMHDKSIDTLALATDLLKSGKALNTFKQIIKAQGGNNDVSLDTLVPSKNHLDVVAHTAGIVGEINNQQISTLCKILGTPKDKKAGMYLHRRIGDKINENDILCTLYATDSWLLKEAKDTIKHMPIYGILEH